jgi:hypothetical protein
MAGNEAYRLWGEAATALDHLLRLIRQAAPSEGEDAPSKAAFVLTQAYLIAVLSALRCAGRIAHECVNQREAIATFILDGEADKDSLNQAALELRELARDVGDAAVEEAEQFRAELALLAESLFDPPPPRQPES